MNRKTNYKNLSKRETMKSFLRFTYKRKWIQRIRGGLLCLENKMKQVNMIAGLEIGTTNFSILINSRKWTLIFFVKGGGTCNQLTDCSRQLVTGVAEQVPKRHLDG